MSIVVCLGAIPRMFEEKQFDRSSLILTCLSEVIAGRVFQPLDWKWRLGYEFPVTYSVADNRIVVESLVNLSFLSIFKLTQEIHHEEGIGHNAVSWAIGGDILWVRTGPYSWWEKYDSKSARWRRRWHNLRNVRQSSKSTSLFQTR